MAIRRQGEMVKPRQRWRGDHDGGEATTDIDYSNQWALTEGIPAKARSTAASDCADEIVHIREVHVRTSHLPCRGGTHILTPRV